ncbi:MAG: putative membrane protein [Candidatus Paceibacteria bacterium]|jgi:uncharacterized membrane protein
MKFLIPYLISTPIFFIIDITWLGFIAKPIYQKYLGYIMAENTKWGAAILFYLLFIAGLVIFAIAPALEKGSLTHAILYGALFGFFAYMTYELTNYAVIEGWPWQIVIIDIVWGIVLGGAVSGLGYYFTKLIG